MDASVFLRNLGGGDTWFGGPITEGEMMKARSEIGRVM